MPSLSHLLLNFLELCPHAVASGFPFDLELSAAACSADEGEAQKLEGLRFSEAPMSAALQPLRALVLRHRNHGAGERAVGLSQLIQNREVIGVGDRYQVAWDMPLRPVGMVIAAARDHGRQLAGAVGDTQRL